MDDPREERVEPQEMVLDDPAGASAVRDAEAVVLDPDPLVFDEQGDPEEDEAHGGVARRRSCASVVGEPERGFDAEALAISIKDGAGTRRTTKRDVGVLVGLVLAAPALRVHDGHEHGERDLAVLRASSSCTWSRTPRAA